MSHAGVRGRSVVGAAAATTAMSPTSTASRPASSDASAATRDATIQLGRATVRPSKTGLPMTHYEWFSRGGRTFPVGAYCVYNLTRVCRVEDIFDPQSSSRGIQVVLRALVSPADVQTSRKGAGGASLLPEDGPDAPQLYERFWLRSRSEPWNHRIITSLQHARIEPAQVMPFDEFQRRTSTPGASREPVYFVRSEWLPDTGTLRPLDPKLLRMRVPSTAPAAATTSTSPPTGDSSSASAGPRTASAASGKTATPTAPGPIQIVDLSISPRATRTAASATGITSKTSVASTAPTLPNARPRQSAATSVPPSSSSSAAATAAAASVAPAELECLNSWLDPLPVPTTATDALTNDDDVSKAESLQGLRVTVDLKPPPGRLKATIDLKPPTATTRRSPANAHGTALDSSSLSALSPAPAAVPSVPSQPTSSLTSTGVAPVHTAAWASNEDQSLVGVLHAYWLVFGTLLDAVACLHAVPLTHIPQLQEMRRTRSDESIRDRLRLLGRRLQRVDEPDSDVADAAVATKAETDVELASLRQQLRSSDEERDRLRVSLAQDTAFLDAARVQQEQLEQHLAEAERTMHALERALDEVKEQRDSALKLLSDANEKLAAESRRAASTAASLEERLVTVKREQFDSCEDALAARQQASRAESLKRKAESDAAEQQQRHEDRLREHREEQTRLANALEDEQMRLTCSACLDAPPAYLYQPCGHATLCADCDLKLTHRICPKCQQKISRKLRAFF